MFIDCPADIDTNVSFSYKTQRKIRTAVITPQSGIRLSESKTQVAQWAASDTVCKQKVLPDVNKQ